MNLLFQKLYQIYYLIRYKYLINNYFNLQVITYYKILFLFIELFLILINIIIFIIPAIFANIYLYYKPKINNYHNIILIHGTNVNSIQWFIFKLYLVIFFNNYNIITIDYNSTQPINLSVNLIIEQINNIHLYNNTILIGHSQGGLISEIIYNTYKKKINKNIIKVFSLNGVINGSHLLTYIVNNKINNFHIDDVDNDMLITSDIIIKNKQYNDKNIYEISNTNDLFIINAINSQYNENVYIGNFGHYYVAVDLICFITFIKKNIYKK